MRVARPSWRVPGCSDFRNTQRHRQSHLQARTRLGQTFQLRSQRRRLRRRPSRIRPHSGNERGRLRQNTNLSPNCNRRCVRWKRFSLRASGKVLADGGLEAVTVGIAAGLDDEDIRVTRPASTAGDGTGPGTAWSKLIS